MMMNETLPPLVTLAVGGVPEHSSITTAI
jgi:hypothetical protein